jgi:hypothetical protein
VQSYTLILSKKGREKIILDSRNFTQFASWKGFLMNNIDTVESGAAFPVQEKMSYISIAQFLLSG